MKMTSLENQFLIAMPTLEDGCFDKTVTYVCEHNDKGAMGLIINSPLNITLVELLKKVDFTSFPSANTKEVIADEVVGEEVIGEEVTGDVVNAEQLKSNDASALKEFKSLVSSLTPIDEKKAQSTDAASDNTTSALQTDHVTFTESKTLIKDALEQLVLLGGPLDQERGFVLHTTQKGWQSSLVISEDLMITSSKDILLALGTDKAPELFIITLGHASWGPGQLEEELQANLWLTTPVDTDIIFNTPIEQRWHKATANLGIDIAHLSSDIGHA